MELKSLQKRPQQSLTFVFQDYTVNSHSLTDVNAKYSTPSEKSPFSDSNAMNLKFRFFYNLDLSALDLKEMVLIAIIGSAFGALVIGIIATALFVKLRSNKSRNMPTLSMSGIMNRD